MDAEELRTWPTVAERHQAAPTLARRLGDVGLAEELVQDAFVEALEHWQSDGVPPNPGGWPDHHRPAAARRIDRQRRAKAGREEAGAAAVDGGHRSGRPAVPRRASRSPAADDDLLSLVFACCSSRRCPKPIPRSR